MSHEFHMPSREDILAGTSRPLPRWLRTLCAVFAVIGLLVFVIGLFVVVLAVSHETLQVPEPHGRRCRTPVVENQSFTSTPLSPSR